MAVPLVVQYVRFGFPLFLNAVMVAVIVVGATYGRIRPDRRPLALTVAAALFVALIWATYESQAAIFAVAASSIWVLDGAMARRVAAAGERRWVRLALVPLVIAGICLALRPGFRLPVALGLVAAPLCAASALVGWVDPARRPALARVARYVTEVRVGPMVLAAATTIVLLPAVVPWWESAYFPDLSLAAFYGALGGAALLGDAVLRTRLIGVHGSDRRANWAVATSITIGVAPAVIWVERWFYFPLWRLLVIILIAGAMAVSAWLRPWRTAVVVAAAGTALLVVAGDTDAGLRVAAWVIAVPALWATAVNDGRQPWFPVPRRGPPPRPVRILGSIPLSIAAVVLSLSASWKIPIVGVASAAVWLLIAHTIPIPAKVPAERQAWGTRALETSRRARSESNRLLDRVLVPLEGRIMVAANAAQRRFQTNPFAGADRIKGDGGHAPRSSNRLAARIIEGKWAAPIVVWMVGQTIVVAVSSLAGQTLRDRVQWDSANFIDIARQGPVIPTDGQQPTVASFPGYPILVRAASLITGDYDTAAVLVAAAAGLGATVLFWRWMAMRGVIGSTRICSLALIVAFPYGFFIFGMAYSDSVFLLFALACFIFLERGHPIAAGVVGALASATRFTGLALIVAITVFQLEKKGVIRLRRNEHREQEGASFRSTLGRNFDRQAVSSLRISDAGVLLSAAGIALFASYCWWRFDDPLAFLHAQRWYGHGGAFETVTWVKSRYIHDITNGYFPVSHLINTGSILLLTVSAALTIPVVSRRFGLGYGVLVAGVFFQTWIGDPIFSSGGRYLMSSFPVFVVAGAILARLPFWFRVLFVSASSALACFMLTRFQARGGFPFW